MTDQVSGKICQDSKHLGAIDVGNKPAAFAAGVGKFGVNGSERTVTDWTIYRFVITTRRIAFKQHTSTFDKFLGTRLGFKLGCKIAVSIFKVGHALLEFYIFLFESLRLIAQQRQTLTKDFRASVLVEELGKGIEEDEGAHIDKP
jgi:hypothetical protein